MRGITKPSDVLRAVITALGLCLVAWFLLNRYSGVHSLDSYQKALASFLSAAKAGDSLKAKSLAASEAEADRVLEQARAHPWTLPTTEDLAAVRGHPGGDEIFRHRAGEGETDRGHESDREPRIPHDTPPEK